MSFPRRLRISPYTLRRALEMKKVLHTSLDERMQEFAEGVLKETVDRFRQGIGNGAVVVIENDPARIKSHGRICGFYV